MNAELDKKLCDTYPEIFTDRHAPMNQTAMCWGFECGDGWYWLIDQLCAALVQPLRREERSYQDRLELRAKIAAGFDVSPNVWLRQYASDQELAKAEAKIAQLKSEIPVAIQVKEKFGGLRFYVRGASDAQYTMIEFAQSMSFSICEYCGATVDVKCAQHNGYWYRSLCSSCVEDEQR